MECICFTASHKGPPFGCTSDIHRPLFVSRTMPRSGCLDEKVFQRHSVNVLGFELLDSKPAGTAGILLMLTLNCHLVNCVCHTVLYDAHVIAQYNHFVCDYLGEIV